MRGSLSQKERQQGADSLGGAAQGPGQARAGRVLRVSSRPRQGQRGRERVRAEVCRGQAQEKGWKIAGGF